MEYFKQYLHLVMLSILYCDITHCVSLDVCNMDDLTAECPLVNQVILMTSAWYGRMRKSRCTEDASFLDCSEDVLSWVDHKCSGRKHCRVKIPDDDLYKSNPCGKDHTPYLHVQYKCQTVESVRFCAAPKMTLTRGQGHLQYPLQGEGHPCKVNLQVPQGQRLNITLYDFGTLTRRKEANCERYVELEETGANRQLCGGDRRITHVYLSGTNSVDITMYRGDKGSPYMLSYQAVGCAMPDLPAGVTMEIEGQTATAVCNTSRAKTRLTCRDKKWVGEIGQCQEAYIDLALGLSLPGGGWGSNIGLVLVVGLGVVIGATAGLTSLLVFAICFKRRRTNGYAYAPSNSSTRYYSADSKTYLHLATMDNTSKRAKPADRQTRTKHAERQSNRPVSNPPMDRQIQSQVTDRQMDRHVNNHPMDRQINNPVTDRHMDRQMINQLMDKQMERQLNKHVLDKGSDRHFNSHARDRQVDCQINTHDLQHHKDKLQSACKLDKPPMMLVKPAEGQSMNRQTDGSVAAEGPSEVKIESKYETPFIETT